MMEIAEAQREVRTVYGGGFVGGLVCGALWLLSAAASTWMSPRHGILILVVGGFLIFPAVTLVLKLAGQPASLSRENPMGGLAMQIAFIVPLLLPVVGAAALYRLDWFYPAMMMVVGAHYLPFTFLYGMWPFFVLGGALLGGGLSLALWLPLGFAAGGWATGVGLILFGIWGRSFVAAEARSGR